MKILVVFVLLLLFSFGCSRQPQNSSAQSARTSPLSTNLAHEFNDKFAGRLANVTFYVTASRNEIMFVGGSGLTEEIANDIQHEKDVFARLQSSGFKQIIFRTIEKDIKVDVPGR